MNRLPLLELESTFSSSNALTWVVPLRAGDGVGSYRGSVGEIGLSWLFIGFDSRCCIACYKI